MTKKSGLKLIVIGVVCLALLLGLNAVTKPLIEANGASEAFAPFFELMPEAKDFELMYDGVNAPDENAAPTIQAIYKETSDLGFVINLSTTEGYTKEPIDFTVAVGNDGKVMGMTVTEYPDTKEVGDDFIASFTGQDSALADVALVSGATFSSSAIKNAVSDGLNYLIDGGFIAAGVKGDDQVLMELLPTVCTGMANSAGVAQFEDMGVSGTYIVSGMKALNSSNCAYIVKDGDASFLVIVNLAGSCKVYDVNGNEVKDALSADAMGEVTADAQAKLVYDNTKDIAKISQLSGGTEPTAIPVSTFNSVVGAYTVGGNYAFAVAPYGYSNIPMSFYYIVDSNGAIVSMTAAEFILESDYFSSYTLDESSYKAGFAGLTADTFDGSAALISGATMSSEAANTATNDVFEAFNAIMENGGENNG